MKTLLLIIALIMVASCSRYEGRIPPHQLALYANGFSSIQSIQNSGKVNKPIFNFDVI